MAKLTTAERNALPNSDFAGPDRSYPIENASHTANAKSRVSQFGSPSLKEKVDSSVSKKFPNFGKKKGLEKLGG